MLTRASGIARSLATYHGIPGRQRRMRRFYSAFLRPGDLAFDVGAHAGTARLGVSRATPTVSTLSQRWRDTVADDAGFSRVTWDSSIEVPVSTLDALIAEHGVPAFCKIDVEGFEADVLDGLSRPLPALSVEYLPAAHDATLESLARIEALGRYVYRYSPVETMTWDTSAGDRWVDAAELRALLDRRRPLGRSGDVYARHVPA